MQKVKIQPFSIIGISVKTTNANNQAAKDITEMWGKFMSENLQVKIPNKSDNTLYSLYTDYTGDHTKPYLAIVGCKVNNLSEIPEGMIGRTFEGGEYQKVTAKGDLTEGMVVKAWMKVWDMNLERKYSVDFETYGEKAQNPHSAEVDIFIAV